MTTSRVIFAIGLPALVGWSVLLSAQSKSDTGPTRGNARRVHGSVFVRVAQKVDDRGRDRRISLPDVEVALKDLATGKVGEPVRTDLFGRFMFPPQKEGTYQLVWKGQNGWA